MPSKIYPAGLLSFAAAILHWQAVAALTATALDQLLMDGQQFGVIFPDHQRNQLGPVIRFATRPPGDAVVVQHRQFLRIKYQLNLMLTVGSLPRPLRSFTFGGSLCHKRSKIGVKKNHRLGGLHLIK
ncbi:hypothetical protein J2067_004860 [Erwinia rhapontici]|nr:hypothetical protein [Erwinia rhapontici]